MRFFNFFRKKKAKTIPDGKYRIIKISKDALFEFIRESVIDHQECFFDVTDGTKIVTCFDINWDTGEFICVTRNELDENEHLQFDLDTQALMSKLRDTTGSMYVEKRYIELSEDEIKKL
ncbi:MAG: hypothetical protein IJY28_09465 [Clostridia bacterium]|nr:hypothetical protein [Clostridia bacterium]